MDEKLEQVLHQVELLCNQNLEFKAALRERLSLSDAQCFPKDTSAFINLQRKNMRQKGYMFYQSVKRDNLRNQLINDYAMMLWHKCVGDIPKMFSCILFQMENMLNAYIQNEGDSVYKAVKDNPDLYVYRYEKEGLKPYTSIAKDYFFDSNGNNKPIEKIGIWAKYTYWYVSTQKSSSFQSLTHSLVSDVINFRNNTEHRNSIKDAPEWMPKHIESWSNDIEAKFSYVDVLLSALLKSIIDINA